MRRRRLRDGDRLSVRRGVPALARAPPPPHGPSGPALAADLVKEEPGDAIDYSVIVRLRNSPKSVQDERDEPPLGNGRANELVGTRHPRPCLDLASYLDKITR